MLYARMNIRNFISRLVMLMILAEYSSLIVAEYRYVWSACEQGLELIINFSSIEKPESLSQAFLKTAEEIVNSPDEIGIVGFVLPDMTKEQKRLFEEVKKELERKYSTTHFSIDGNAEVKSSE